MTEYQAIKELKAFLPYLRRTRSTGIIHSGGKQTILDCVCGSRHTCATSYRNAKHVSLWREEHSKCAEEKLLKYEKQC